MRAWSRRVLKNLLQRLPMHPCLSLRLALALTLAQHPVTNPSPLFHVGGHPSLLWNGFPARPPLVLAFFLLSRRDLIGVPQFSTATTTTSLLDRRLQICTHDRLFGRRRQIRSWQRLNDYAWLLMGRYTSSNRVHERIWSYPRV